jgi:hypothetical protein
MPSTLTVNNTFMELKRKYWQRTRDKKYLNKGEYLDFIQESF